MADHDFTRSKPDKLLLFRQTQQVTFGFEDKVNFDDQALRNAIEKTAKFETGKILAGP